MDPRVIGEERSIEIHRWIACRIREDPSVLARARQRVQEWDASGGVHRDYVDAWREQLDGPVEELCLFLVDPGQRARSLRQVSPFAGAVDPRVRWRIWRDVRERLERR